MARTAAASVRRFCTYRFACMKTACALRREAANEADGTAMTGVRHRTGDEPFHMQLVY